jgi:hypothetical protein
MLDAIVRYLRSNEAPFKLESYASPEPLPAVAYRRPPGAALVDTWIMRVDDMPAIACVPAGTRPDLAALSAALDAVVLEGSPRDLPAPFDVAGAPLPALGGALGVLTIVDASLVTAGALVFCAFSKSDFIELPYEAFALLEHPRVAAFAVMGELPESTAT